jgi:hypothetical protein
MSAEWIPPEQRDTSWYIFNELYLCTVPHLQTMSVDYLQYFGMPTTGDTDWDRALANERVQRMLSIDKMTDYFKQGVVVGVMKEADTKRIYERVMDHLNAWRKKLAESYHVNGAPLDDLVLLDSFAAAVYKHARHQDRFDQSFVDSLLARHIGSTLKVTRDTIMKAPAAQVTVIHGREEKEQAPKFPEHNSMADMFLGRERVQKGGSKWK